jgi:site-specific recombinase XerD
VRLLHGFLKNGGYPPLEAATSEHLREWLNGLRAKGNRPSTVNTRYRGAHAFYKWLVEEGETKENPLQRIAPPSIPESVQPYYTPDEIQAALRVLRGRRLRGVDAARTRAILLVLFDTGVRASELCARKLENVDWDNQTILVSESKGGNQRVISLGTASTRALLSYLRVRGGNSPFHERHQASTQADIRGGRRQFQEHPRLPSGVRHRIPAAGRPGGGADGLEVAGDGATVRTGSRGRAGDCRAQEVQPC